MNTRFMCGECGSQPCMCLEEECRACNGEGQIATGEGIGFNRGDVDYEPCTECDGDGWIKCSGQRTFKGECRFEHCYCEAAYDRQQADNLSEPPMSAREQHLRAWEQKQELRK